MNRYAIKIANKYTIAHEIVRPKVSVKRQKRRITMIAAKQKHKKFNPLLIKPIDSKVYFPETQRKFMPLMRESTAMKIPTAVAKSIGKSMNIYRTCKTPSSFKQNKMS